jgi:hypothetical protein
MDYYFNLFVENETKIQYENLDIDVSQDAITIYINNNAWLDKQLSKISTQYKLKHCYFKVVFEAINRLGSVGTTMATQKRIAEYTRLSLATVERVISAARKGKLISVKHRYSSEKQTRRRISSVTTLNCFIEFVNLQKHKTIKKYNKANQHTQTSKFRVVDITTGEIVTNASFDSERINC